MTLFRVRHEFRMWHDCGVTRWGRAILANSGKWSLFIPNSHWKWWCDIMMPLEEQRAGETRRFECYGRPFGHGEARNRALVGGLDKPKWRKLQGYPAKLLAGVPLSQDKAMDHSAPK